MFEMFGNYHLIPEKKKIILVKKKLKVNGVIVDFL